MSENWQSEPVKTTRGVRRFIIYVALLVLASWPALSPCGSRLVNAPAVLLMRSANRAWSGWRIASPPQPLTRGGEIMRQPVKLPVTSLLSYGQKPVMALIRPSRRQKWQVYSRC